MPVLENKPWRHGPWYALLLLLATSLAVLSGCGPTRSPESAVANGLAELSIPF